MSRRAVAVIIAGFLTVFIAFAIRYAYGLLLPQMLPVLGTSKAGAGVIYSSYFLAYTLGAPLLGLLADRFDVRVLLTVFVGLLGAGAALMAFAASVPMAALFFTLAGIGHSACWVPVVTVVQRWVGEKRRGAALAFADLGSAVGIVIWSLVIPLIVVRFSWQGVWIALGLTAWAVALANFLLVRDRPPQPEKRPGTAEAEPTEPERLPIRAAYRRLFGEPAFWLIGFSYMAVGFAILIPFTFMTIYAVEELGIAYGTATRLVAVIAAAGIVGKLVLGSVSDSIGRVRVMIFCSVFIVVGGAGIATADSFDRLVIATAILGFAYGALWPVYGAAARDFFPVSCAGSAVGLWTLLLGFGSIFSPLLAGRVIDITGRHAGAFVLTAVAAAFSCLLLLPLVRRRPLPPPDR